MATAVHILCVLDHVGPDGTTSEAIAHSLDTNPVVVRRMLKDLAGEMLVHVRQGRDGGVRLARPAEEITLASIYRAVRSDLFAARPSGNPRCPVQQTIPSLLTPIFAMAEQAVTQTMEAVTLANLARQVPPPTRAGPAP